MIQATRLLEAQILGFQPLQAAGILQGQTQDGAGGTRQRHVVLMKRQAGDTGIEIEDAQGSGRRDDGRHQNAAGLRLSRILRGVQGPVRQDTGSEDTPYVAPGLIDDGAIGPRGSRGSRTAIPVGGEGRLTALTVEQQDAALLSGNRFENPLQQVLRNLFRLPRQLNAGADFQHRGQGAPGPGIGGSFFRGGLAQPVHAVRPGLSAVSSILLPCANGG